LIECQQKHRNVLSRVEDDHTISATFSLASAGDAELSGASGSRDFVARARVIGHHRNDCLALGFCEMSRFDIGKVRRCSDDGMHVVFR